MKRRTNRITLPSCWEQLRAGKAWRRLSMTLLVAVMTMTAQTARAQELGEPDLGRIICNPDDVTGGSLAFYYRYTYDYHSEIGGFLDQISIDGTTHMSGKLRSTDCQSVESNENCVFIKGNPDATHVLSGYTITAKKASNEDVAVYNIENDVYYFEMPADGSDVIFTATFKGMFDKAKLGDEGHPHINFVTFDNTGKRQTVSTADLTDPVYVLDGTEKHLGQSGSETWYVAKSGLSYTTPNQSHHEFGIILDGDVHLILTDGANVNFDCNEEFGSSLYGGNNSLILYSQGSSTSEGKFTIQSEGTYLTEDLSSFIVNGGVVNSLGKDINNFSANNVTIRGGEVTFSREDENSPAVYGNITILGGQVTVVGKIEGANITLGWTDATDFIMASSYEPYSEGWMKIADGQAMIVDGTDSYSGTLDDDQIEAIGGKTLKPNWTGTGTAADPYMINRPGELDLLAQRVNSRTGDDYAPTGYEDKFFKLGADIAYSHTNDWDDASSDENNYTPIGSYYNGTVRSFRGTFDGQGHTVSGIRIYKGGNERDVDGFDGLFGSVNNCTVKNVTVSDMRITGYALVGGIVGYTNYYSRLENCHATATVALNAVQNGAYNFGGIVGNNNYYGTINGCTSAVTITTSGTLGCHDFGGIVGNTDNDCSVKNCLAVGVAIPYVAASGAIAGRFAGDSNSHNYYSGCTLAGTLTASGIGVGKDDNSNVRHDVTDNDGAVSAFILSESAAVPAMYEDDKVVFRRSFTQGKASTICLPFSIDADQAAAAGKFYTFVGVDKSTADWEVIMQEADTSADPPVQGNEVSTLAANTPYLFMPAATAPVLFYGPAAASVSAGEVSDTEGWTFIGTYEKKTWEEGQTRLYGFAGKEFTLSNGEQIDADDIGSFCRFNYGTCDAFRCYLMAPESSGARGVSKPNSLPETLKVRLVKADGTTTAIGTLDTRTGEVTFGDNWYDLNGRRLEGQPTQKGVYIHKGKRIIKN